MASPAFMRAATAIAALLSATSIARADALPAPEIFAPGVISGPANDGSPTFAPDGKTLYFTRSTASWGAILEATRKPDGSWSEPVVAPFSGEWSDSSPGMSPDGSYLIFVSLRPKAWRTDPKAKGPRLAQLYKVRRLPRSNSNSYTSSNSNSNTSSNSYTWSEAEPLSDAVNRGPSIWKPSIASDGTLYFVVIDAQGGKRLYSSLYIDGMYQAAEPLPFSDGTTGDVDPEIAPDRSFLIFCSSGRVKDNPKDHLFFVVRTSEGWGPVQPIHYSGDDGQSIDDEPHLGPDRRLYFSSDRGLHVDFPRTREQAALDLQRLEAWDNSNSNVWSFPIAPWIKPG